MANYETFSFKGKDYKFRVGRDTPLVKPLINFNSKYYIDKQKGLSIAMWLTFLPLVVLGIVFFANVGSNDFSGTLGWFTLLFIVHGVVIHEVWDKIGDADKVLASLKEHAEDREYLEAYNAWMLHRK